MNEFSFSVSDFNGNFKCEDIHIGQINNSCNNFSYSFKPGVYALTGEITDGGWGFAYFLTGECKSYRIGNDAEVFVNNTCVDFKTFSEKYVQNLGISRRNKILDLFDKKTVHSWVDKNLKHSGLSETAEDIKCLFDISPDRFERNIKCVGFELPFCKAAIGFAAKIKVFVFPYVTRNLYPNAIFLKKLCDILRENRCIVLLPVHECAWLEGVYDSEVNIQKIFIEEAQNDCK